MFIKFTDKKYVNDFLDGNLYMSSMSKFIEVKNCGGPQGQQDVLEGIACTFNADHEIVPQIIREHVLKDARVALDAYKYVNLLCMIQCRKDNFHILDNPKAEVYGFGDSSLVIKNEYEFLRRIEEAINNLEEDFIASKVNYYKTIDSRYMREFPVNSLTLGCNEYDVTLKEVLAKATDVKHYGCLDKDVKFAEQQEFRVCRLPSKLNTEDKQLYVGNLRDIVEVVQKDKLRDYVRRYFYKYRQNIIADIVGTCSYEEFKSKIENIDGRCNIFVDIGQKKLF